MQITDANTGIGGGALCIFMEKIITILVKQIAECGKTAEKSMAYFRRTGKYEPPRKVLNVSQEETCESCFHLNKVNTGLTLLQAQNIQLTKPYDAWLKCTELCSCGLDLEVDNYDT